MFQMMVRFRIRGLFILESLSAWMDFARVFVLQVSGAFACLHSCDLDTKLVIRMCFIEVVPLSFASLVSLHPVLSPPPASSDLLLCRHNFNFLCVCVCVSS